MVFIYIYICIPKPQAVPESGGINRDNLPEVLSSTLDHIVGQLDMLTRTMAVLEQRVCNTEDRISGIVQVSVYAA
jgi:hypothetical protein